VDITGCLSLPEYCDLGPPLLETLVGTAGNVRVFRTLRSLVFAILTLVELVLYPPKYVFGFQRAVVETVSGELLVVGGV